MAVSWIYASTLSSPIKSSKVTSLTPAVPWPSSGTAWCHSPGKIPAYSLRSPGTHLITMKTSIPHRGHVRRKRTTWQPVYINMPSSKHASTYKGELAALEAALEAEGFRRFKEMEPQYHQVDQQGPIIRRATRPTLFTSQRRATPLTVITARPQVRAMEPTQDPGLKAKYLGLISARRPLTVTDSPPTPPEISTQGATLERRRPVPIIAAPPVEPGSRAGSQDSRAA